MKINGEVTSSDTGKQLKGAKVTLFIGDSELAVLYTDRNGRFEHTEREDYSGETVRYVVEMDEYKPQEVKQQIEGEDVDLNIQLIPVRQAQPVTAPPKRDWMKIGAIALFVLLVSSNIYLLMFAKGLDSKIEDNRIDSNQNRYEISKISLKIKTNIDEINSINSSIAELKANSWQKAVGGRRLVPIHQMWTDAQSDRFYIPQSGVSGSLHWARDEGVRFYAFH